MRCSPNATAPAVAVGGDVANRENGHGDENRTRLDRMDAGMNVSMLPVVRNLAGTG